MRWKGRRTSANVEDRRGMPAKGMVGGGIGVVVLILAVYFLGGDPRQIMELMQQTGGTQTGAPQQRSAEENELAEFVSVVLAETEDVWKELFAQKGLEYKYPKLILFTDSVQSACGHAGAATGPFYCPGDTSVYIDLAFYDELREKFRAPGDFAMAYVIAHEVGHHVQKLLGTSDKVMALRSQLAEKDFNRYLVRLELQADYFAGVWAHYAKRMNILEEGDLEEAMTAASAVGDDSIQKQARGYVVPDSFTHGTSEQRMAWFSKGLHSGAMDGGDTFNAEIQ